MKVRIISIILIAVVASFYSCERDLETEGISRITTFATITLEGESPLFLNVGETYDEPGGSTSTGDPITISGTVDVNTPGIYTVFYSAENSDGFEAQVTRTIYVSNTGDFTTSIEGLYISTVVGVTHGTTFGPLQFVRIWATGNPNEYYLSAGLGGFYSLGRSYGDAYDSQHTVTVDFGTNTGTVTDSSVPGFGLPVSVTDFVIDPATRTITYTGDFFGAYIMQTTLVQYQF